MIQRIQTIYLLIASAIVALLFISPFAEIAGKDGIIYLFDISGIYQIGYQAQNILSKTLPVTIITSIIMILLLVSILQFKNRILQIKMTNITIILLFILTGLLGYYIWKSTALIGGSYTLKGVVTSPLIAVILLYLAKRGIAKDQKLIKSIDRIR